MSFLSYLLAQGKGCPNMRKSGRPRALALAVPVRGFRGRDIRLFLYCFGYFRGCVEIVVSWLRF